MFLDFIKQARASLVEYWDKSSHAIRATWDKTYEFLSENPYGLSAIELSFVLVLSNSALLFLVFTTLVDTRAATLSWSFAIDVVRAAVSPTEVLVYLLAIIAPALWIMAHNWRARKHVGFYWLLLIVQGVLVVCSAYIYGRAKTGGVGNPGFVENWAVWCLVLGLGIWYATLVYKRSVLDRVESQRRPSGKAILDDLAGMAMPQVSDESSHGGER